MLLSPLFLGGSAAAKPTNFVVLFADDNGWGDMGVNNPNVTETPRVQRMGREGLTFFDFHASYSVCTASRGALLTGRLAPRTGVAQNFGPNSEHGIAPGELTIANVLGAHGYDSHMVGKWHLGHAAGYHPTYRGFQSFNGLPYSGDMGCLDVSAKGCTELGSPACPALCPVDSSGGNGDTAVPHYVSSQPWAGTNCSGRACSEEIRDAPFDPNALNTHYVARVEKIVERYGRGGAREGTPLFLYVAFAHTHTPMGFAAQWANTSTRAPVPARSSNVYGDTLAELDGAIGSILDAIDGAGLGHDTLVVLSADNGPADLGSVFCWAIGSPGPFTGEWMRAQGKSAEKGTVWEGGHRVVGVMRWLGHIVAPGRTTRALAQTVDYMTTFAAIAGVFRCVIFVVLVALLCSPPETTFVFLLFSRYRAALRSRVRRR